MNYELAQFALETWVGERRTRYASKRAKPARVLLVDDDAIGRGVASRWLATEFDVTAVASGEEALLVFRPRRFAVVVTDHRMPSMTGLELLEQLRVRDPRVRRVLTSGIAIPGIEGYIGSGVVHRFVEKPADLRQVLRELIAVEARRS